LVDVCVKDLDVLNRAQVEDDVEALRDYRELLFKHPVEFLPPEDLSQAAKLEE